MFAPLSIHLSSCGDRRGAKRRGRGVSLSYRIALDTGPPHLLVNDAPLGVDDALVLVRVGDPDLGVLLLALELELDVEEEDLGLDEFLGHLLVTGVGEGLLERDSLDEERGADLSSWYLLDGNEVEVGEIGLEA